MRKYSHIFKENIYYAKFATVKVNFWQFERLRLSRSYTVKGITDRFSTLKLQMRVIYSFPM